MFCRLLQAVKMPLKVFSLSFEVQCYKIFQIHNPNSGRVWLGPHTEHTQG